MLHRLGGGVTGVGGLSWVALDAVGGFKLGVGGVGGSESVAGGSVVGLVVGVVGASRWVGSSRRARRYLASCSGAGISSAMGVGSVVGLEGIVLCGGFFFTKNQALSYQKDRKIKCKTHVVL